MPLVFEAAHLVAQGLLIRVGQEVGTAAGAVIGRLGLEQTDVEVILAGSVFKGKGPLFLDAVAQAVHRVAPRAAIRELEPVAEAVLLALEGLGIKPNKEIYANVRNFPKEPKMKGGQ